MNCKTHFYVSQGAPSMTESNLMTQIDVPAPLPRRIQLSRKKGWSMPEDGVKVDRTTEFGNPFAVFGPCKFEDDSLSWIVQRGIDSRRFPSKADAQAAAVRLYTAWLNEPAQAKLRDRIRLRFKEARPACWCGLSDPCHGDTIADVALTPLECQAA
jgi:Domain of unknown function (DUF4326)